MNQLLQGDQLYWSFPSYSGYEVSPKGNHCIGYLSIFTILTHFTVLRVFLSFVTYFTEISCQLYQFTTNNFTTFSIKNSDFMVQWQLKCQFTLFTVLRKKVQSTRHQLVNMKFQLLSDIGNIKNKQKRYFFNIFILFLNWMNVLSSRDSSVAIGQFIWDKEGNMSIPSILQGLLHFNPRPICCQCYKTFNFITDAATKSWSVSD